MKIGYCPTMENAALEAAKKNNIEIINMGSASMALRALNSHKVDIVLIGRVAEKTEFDGFEKRINPGYTLITDSKKMIRKDELINLEIHTNISKKLISSLYPELNNVIYHDSLEESLRSGNIQLISWDDWSDDFYLLIPIDEFNNKDPRFRVPHYYFKDKSLMQKINQIIKNA